LTAHPWSCPAPRASASSRAWNRIAGEYRIVKQRFSAFMFTELDLILRRKGITHLAVTGTQLPFCLRATLFDGLCLGYDMTLLTDASSSRTPRSIRPTFRDIRDAGIACVSVDEYLRGINTASLMTKKSFDLQ
jgi:nicotinamidase-related amidase